MKNLIDHLQNSGYGIFQNHEMNEPLMLTYNILSWAVRDQADTLIVSAYHAAWYKGEEPIDQFRLEALIPILGLNKIVEQIAARDQVVKNMLKLVSEEDDKFTYKILYQRRRTLVPKRPNYLRDSLI